MSSPEEISKFLESALTAPGTHEYRMLVTDGRVVELIGAPAEAVATQPVDDAYVSMKDAAKLLHRSYFWLIRNWEKIGLHRSDFGRPYVFARKEIDEFLVRNRHQYRGRPRKGRGGAL